MSETEKIDRFTSSITADAMNESKRIYEEINKTRDQAVARAEDESLSDSFGFIKSEISKIRAEFGRKKSLQVMENKRALYLRREEMRKAVLDDVVEKLKGYCATEQYEKQLSGQLDRVLELFQADTVVELAVRDMRLAEKLGKNRPGLTFREGNFQLGGLRAYCSSKRLEVDESFDTTLQELGSRFAELMGLELSDSEL